MIGDRVKVRDYADIPEEHRAKALGRMSGEIGTVTDKLYSEVYRDFVYTLQLDSYDRSSKKLWLECHLEPYVEATTEYIFEFENLTNVVVAIFYEVCGDSKTEIARGHGHIIHEGALGIAQASSYALKKIYEKMNGGIV